MRVFLEDVPEKYAFYLKNGKKLLNIEQLAKELENMADEVFYHHVTPERNDFHNWIRDIVLDLELAEKVLNAKTKEEARKIINERIAFIKSQIKPIKKQKSNKKAKSKVGVGKKLKKK
ncbi:MAG: hypothetical protein QXG86_02765 [Candidatus Woesearchaeota archaeon]